MKGNEYDRLNPEPTEVQWARYQRHKAAGTSPGNPKWYRPQVLRRFEFKAGLPPKYPVWVERHKPGFPPR